MVEKSDQKYSVLVVDDDPSWVDEITYIGSSIDFSVSRDIRSALASIESDNQYDLVIVDLYLKNDIGLTLIDEAKERGITTPFVVASNENKDVLRNSNGELFERYLESDALNYLNKSDIKSARNFEQILVSIIDTFSQAVTQMMKIYEERCSEIAQVAGAISESNAVVISYTHSIAKSSSFKRLCKQIDSDAGRIKMLAHLATTRSQSPAHHDRRYVKYYDFVPDFARRAALQLSLRRMHTRRNNVDFGSDVSSTIAKAFKNVLSGNKSQAVVRIFTAYADDLSRSSDFSNAINVLVSLSDELKRHGMAGMSIGVRLLSAHLLEEKGRKAAARVFVLDALEDARTLSEHQYLGYIDRKFSELMPGLDHEYD